MERKERPIPPVEEAEAEEKGRVPLFLLQLSNLHLKLLGLSRNTDLEKGIQYCKELFAEARSSIKIAAGNLDSGFYNDPRIVQALEEANERGVRIEIVYGPNADPKSEEILRLQKEKRVNLYKLGRRPSSQFIVIDGSHVRTDDFHHTNQGERRAYIRRNTIALGQALELDFARLIEESLRSSPRKET